MKKVTKTKIYLIVTAIMLVALGCLFIAKPVAGMLEIAWLAGLLMLVSGCVTLAFSIRQQAIMPNAASSTLLSILQILLGIMFLCNKGLTAMTLVVMFTMWIVVEGVQLAVLSFDYKKYGFKQWWLMLLLGICSVVLGFYCLFNPIATGATISIMVGIAIISNGITRLVAFFSINKVQNRIKGAQERVEQFLSEND